MQKTKPSFFRTWLIAVRPFALPASVMPVIFGSVMAGVMGGSGFNPVFFALSLLAIVSIHCGANILSDVNDFKRGLDKVPTPVSGAIVRGLLKPGSALIGAIVFFFVGGTIGAFVIYRIGLPLLIIGLVGVSIGIFYTVRPLALKYNALGDLAVFLAFGLLGTLGAWTVQTGQLSWIPLLWSIPLSLLIVAILHANNWRDRESDAQRKITTVAHLLGERGSRCYYGMLVFGAFGGVVLLLILTRTMSFFGPPMPLTFVITFAAFPLALKLMRHAHKNPDSPDFIQFVSLDAGTAKLSLVFSILSTVALLLHLLIEKQF